jgi:hypothetical protein
VMGKSQLPGFLSSDLPEPATQREGALRLGALGQKRRAGAVELTAPEVLAVGRPVFVQHDG